MTKEEKEAQLQALIDNLNRNTRRKGEIWARAKLIRGEELTPQELKLLLESKPESDWII